MGWPYVFWTVFAICLISCCAGAAFMFAKQKGWLGRGRFGKGGGRLDPVLDVDARRQEMEDVEEQLPPQPEPELEFAPQAQQGYEPEMQQQLLQQPQYEEQQPQPM